MIKALPHKCLPCGPMRQENDTSQTGSGNSGSAENGLARSSISPPSTGAGTIMHVTQEQLMRLFQQMQGVPQLTVQLPLASPVPSFGTSSFSTATPGSQSLTSQSSTAPSPATVPTPAVDLTMECDDGMIYIPDDDLDDEI